jgi:tripartite-type tricarboxylate transporter receptor subunit TctC
MSGSPENLQALLGGKVEGVTNHHAVFPAEVDAGRVRIIGVFEKKRNVLYPGAETFIEAGYDVTFDSYACIIGPKGLPDAIVSILHDAFKKAMVDPLFTEPMKEKGLDLFYKNPQDLKAILMQDYEANAKVVRAIGLSAE